MFNKDKALSLSHLTDRMTVPLTYSRELSAALQQTVQPVSSRERIDGELHPRVAGSRKNQTAFLPRRRGLLLRGKEGRVTPCIDYRGLNDITVKNKYPLPLINSVFESLQDLLGYERVMNGRLPSILH